MSTNDAVTESQTERVRQRAHELWEQEGRPEGLQGEHWARACHELQMEEKSGTDNTANRAKAGIDDAGSNIKDVANTFGQKAPIRSRSQRKLHYGGALRDRGSWTAPSSSPMAQASSGSQSTRSAGSMRNASSTSSIPSARRTSKQRSASAPASGASTRGSQGLPPDASSAPRQPT
jgi:hypothetical protein